MAKPDSLKVIPQIVEYAISTGKDMNALYSECVRYSYRLTGRLACGFDAKDMVAYIKENYPDMFDGKGKRIK